MKFLTSSIFRTVVILGIWFLCVRQIFLEFDHSRFLDFTLPLLFCVAGVISLFSFFVDYVRYKTSKRFVHFVPTVVTMLCFAAVIGTSEYLKKQDKSPTVLYASIFKDGLNSFSIDFRENETYKCSNGRFFGDSYYSRGKYSIKDSVIYLDKSSLFDIVRTDRLRIVAIPKSENAKKGRFLALLFGVSRPDTLAEPYLFQLDNRGEIIPSAIVLRVNMDFVDYRD